MKTDILPPNYTWKDFLQIFTTILIIIIIMTILNPNDQKCLQKFYAQQF